MFMQTAVVGDKIRMLGLLFELPLCGFAVDFTDDCSLKVRDIPNAGITADELGGFAFRCVLRQQLYAFGPHAIDSLQQLADEGIAYTKCTPRFPRSKLHAMLRDRSYIGEVRYRDQWHPGTHTPLIDRTTWDRVQVKLGAKIYESHDLLFAKELITCAHCERPITRERKTKQTKSGERHYTYYRCSKYNAKGHPRTRVNETRLNQQVLDLFDKIKIKDEGIRTWFSEVLKARRSTNKKLMEDQKSELDRQLTLLRQHRTAC